MKRLFLLLTVASLPLAPLLAEQPAETPAAAEADAVPEAAEVTDFIRIEEDKEAARLQTAVTSYRRDGVLVDLIGAVHIADKKYYEELNTLFEDYEVLLFEMVGGENLVDGKFPEDGEEPNLQAKFLRGMVSGMAKFLKLSGQLDEIDYSKENFVHADLTIEQFAKQQKDKDESLFSFALAAAQQAENDGVAQPDPAKLLAALLAGNSDGLKLEMIKTLGQGDDQIAGLAGNNVIIADRNVKALQVLDEQIEKEEMTKIGIFYGAAHFPDMEKRLVEAGFQQTDQEWLTAWNVPKPKKEADEEEAADDEDN